MARKDRSTVNYTPEGMEARVTGGRSVLLIAAVLTVINVVLVMLDNGTEFLFSISAPYYLVMIGKGMDNNFVDGPWSVTGTYTITALVIAVVVVAVVLLCWFLGKERRGWLIAGMVLFIVDTLALIYFALIYLENPASCVIDLCIHLWIIYLLSRAVVCSRKLKELEETEIQTEETHGTSPDLD